MNASPRDTAIEIRMIVTHALMGHPEVEPHAVDLIVDQCANLVAQAQLSIPFTTTSAGHLNVMNAHLSLLMLIKDMRDTQVAYFASRKGTRFGDRKILARSKKLEGDLDRLVAEQLANTDTYLFTDNAQANADQENQPAQVSPQVAADQLPDPGTSGK